MNETISTKTFETDIIDVGGPRSAHIPGPFPHRPDQKTRDPAVRQSRRAGLARRGPALLQDEPDLEVRFRRLA